jgi:hypothetical protein
MSLGIWLAFYIGLSFLIGRLYGAFVGWKFVRVALFPGMALAALGRATACLVTGNDAKKCDCWRTAGPVESKGGPEGGTFFRLLFAVSPFILALVGILLADHFLDRPVNFHAELPQISANAGRAGHAFFDTCIDFSLGIWNALKDERLGNPSFWIFIYLAMSFVIGCSPSVEDAKAVAITCGVVVVLDIACEVIGVRVVVSEVNGAFWRGFSLLVAYTIFVLFASGILFVPVKLLRDSRKEK